MKKIIFMLFVGLLFSSCAITRDQSVFMGQFSGPAFHSSMTLFLNPDSTFLINWRYDYSGKWEVLNRNHILLKFDEITNSEMFLSSGVILDRERVVKIVNRNKIVMLPYDDVLRRVE